MAVQCLICNTRGITIRNSFNIFEEQTNSLVNKEDGSTTQTTLQSNRKLHEVVSDIIGISLQPTKVHCNKICKKCFKTCLDYDKIQTRLSNLKTEIRDQFKHSIKTLNIDYNNYPNAMVEQPSVATPTPLRPIGKKLVLPASKLQPITPELLLKVGKFQGLTKGNIILPQIKSQNASTLNLKVTVGTSVLTHTIKTTTTNPGIKPTTNVNLIESLKQEIDDITTSPSQTFSVNSLPSNFMSEVITKSDRNDGQSDGNDGQSDGNDDEQSMEIDEDCSLSIVPVSSANSNNLVLEVGAINSKPKTPQIQVSEWEVDQLQTLAGDDQFILGKVQILNQGEEIDDDEESHTIVLEGENGSILRMVSGQKFMYEGREISLVMTDDDQPQDENEQNDEQDDDSNDETAIELQMAGDEETAKAILAAAQEQGGAFIKVESGEMFRVHTVDQRLTNVVVKKGDSFQCLLCDVKNDTYTPEEGEGDKPSVTGDAESMMRHLKRFHDARVYICQFCSAIMRRKVDYTAHIAEHASSLKGARNGAGNHQCSSCGKLFGSRVLLLEHANVHAGLRPYACSSCHKTFASKYTFQAHLKTHANRPRPFKCTLCEKTFLTQQHLIQHEKTHTGVKDFVCNICNKAFSTQHNLEVHGVVHSGHKPFRCTHCHKAFARRAELRDHARTHTGERPYPCDICGSRFTQRSNLHSHRRATHLDDKRHHCTQCPKRFKRRRLLEYHIKASHTGERPLKCDICGASFVYPEHYKKHLRIHSGDRPFACEICGKKFNSADNRNTHRFVHSDKKPYECVSCGAGYMRKQQLLAHMAASGHLAESIVVNQPRVIKVADNGDIGESIHAGQPRVLKVTENGPVEISQVPPQSSNKFDAIFEGAELDNTVESVNIVRPDGFEEAKYIISNENNLILQVADKQTLSLLQDSGDPTLLTIHNVSEQTQATILETVSSEELSDQTEIIANDENGGVVRLIQIKLPDGNNGWVALNR